MVLGASGSARTTLSSPSVGTTATSTSNSFYCFLLLLLLKKDSLIQYTFSFLEPSSILLLLRSPIEIKTKQQYEHDATNMENTSIH